MRNLKNDLLGIAPRNLRLLHKHIYDHLSIKTYSGMFNVTYWADELSLTMLTLASKVINCEDATVEIIPISCFEERIKNAQPKK